MSSSETPPSESQPPSVPRIIVIGALLVVLGPVSIGSFTPALADIMLALDTSESTAKLATSAFLAGFCGAQLICGPLSDAYGRRVVACCFLGLYVVATVFAIALESIDALILLRFLQGIGAAVGWSVSRAVIRDVLNGPAAAQALSLVVTCVAVAPIFAPALGGVAVEVAGWKGSMMIMCLIGTTSLIGIVFFLPETNRMKEPSAANPLRMLKTFALLLSDVQFRGPALALGSAVGVMYVMLTAVPFVMIKLLGFTPGEFGLLMIPHGFVIMASAALASRTVRRMPLLRVARLGLCIQLFAVAMQALLFATWGANAISVLLPLSLLGCGSSFVLPAASALAVARYPTIAGTASSLAGFLQIASGVLGSVAVAVIPYPLATLLLVPLVLISGGMLAIGGVFRGSV